MSPTQSLHGPAKGQSTVGHAMHGAGQSSVGQPSFYEAGDQRNEPRSVIAERDRYTEGTKGSHKNLDSKDERSIANKLSSAQERKHESTHRKNVGNIEVEISKRDPTMPGYVLICQAQLHGNEPSKGAKIDRELKKEDELRLREKVGK